MKQLILVTLVVTALIAYASGNKDGPPAKKEPGGNKLEVKTPANSEQKGKWKNFLEALFGSSKESGDKKSSMPKIAMEYEDV